MKKVKKNRTAREIIQYIFIIICVVAAAYAILWARNIALSEHEINIPFNLIPRFKWVRPNDTKPNKDNTTNCLTKVYSNPNCQGDFIGYKKCGPCSLYGKGICVELNGSKIATSEKSQSTCTTASCADGQTEYVRSNKEATSADAYDQKPTVLKWGATIQKKSECNWKRKDNSLPTSPTGNCLTRFYQAAKCGGEIVGYDNCNKTSTCSLEGKGICVEIG